jgi:hypothetical protein
LLGSATCWIWRPLRGRVRLSPRRWNVLWTNFRQRSASSLSMQLGSDQRHGLLP